MVNIIKITLCSACAALTAVSAQIRIKVAIIPYTMQNFAVILSGFLLGSKFGCISQILYLTLITFGLPFASGLKGGVGVLLGPTGGYLISFPIAAALAGYLRKIVENITNLTKTKKNGLKKFVLMWMSANLSAIPIYVLGSAYLLLYGAKFDLLLFAVLLFVPQDFFMDHVLAVLSYEYIKDFLNKKGIIID